MRGQTPRDRRMFGYVMSEERVPKDHPLRPIRQMAEQGHMTRRSFFRALMESVGMALLLFFLLGASPVSEAPPHVEPRAKPNDEHIKPRAEDHVHGHFTEPIYSSESSSPEKEKCFLLIVEVFGGIICLIPIVYPFVAWSTSRAGLRKRTLAVALRIVGKQIGVAGTNLLVAIFVVAAAFFAFEPFDRRPAVTNWLLFLCFLALISAFPYIVVKISSPVVRLLDRESAQLAAGLLVVSLCTIFLALLTWAFVATLH